MPFYEIQGRIQHPRTINALYPGGLARLRRDVDPNTRFVFPEAKLRYVWAFDKKLRRRLREDALPYPKHADEVTGVTAGVQPEKGRFDSDPSAPAPSDRSLDG